MYALIIGIAIVLGSLFLIFSGQVGAGLASLGIFAVISLAAYLIPRTRAPRWFLVRLSMNGLDTAITGPFNSEAAMAQFVASQNVAEKSFAYQLPASTVKQAKELLARGNYKHRLEYQPQVEPVSLN